MQSRKQLDRPIPRQVDELTTEWLTAVLGAGYPGIEVTSVEIPNIVWGSATKVLVKLTYAKDPGPDGPPAELCVKGGFDDRLWARGPSFGTVLQLEALFYRDISPTFAAPAPQCYYAQAEPPEAEVPNGVVILEDLVAKGARFGSRLEPWGPDLVAQAVEDMAIWHGTTWDGAGVGDLPWIAVGSYPNRYPYIDRVFSAAPWKEFLDTEVGALIPEEMRDVDRMVRALRRMWELSDQMPLSLSHQTPHVGNTYIDAEGKPHFLDWQCVCLAPGLDDVNHFVTGAMTIEDRRAHEPEIVRHYLDALAANGGPTFDFDDAWRDYRMQTMHGFLCPPAPSMMQTEEARLAITPRLITAIEDHETLSLLGV